jgi:hypothetical protein
MKNTNKGKKTVSQSLSKAIVEQLARFQRFRQAQPDSSINLG